MDFNPAYHPPKVRSISNIQGAYVYVVVNGEVKEHFEAPSDLNAKTIATLAHQRHPRCTVMFRVPVRLTVWETKKVEDVPVFYRYRWRNKVLGSHHKRPNLLVMPLVAISNHVKMVEYMKEVCRDE